MQKLWKCQAVLLAVIGLTAYGVEPAAEIEITSFSISPMQVGAETDIQLRWRVRNIGGVPLTVQPLVQFVRGQNAYTVEADQPRQVLAASAEAVFTAKARPPFRQPGRYAVWVTARDFDGKATGCGFIYERTLKVEAVAGKRPQAERPPITAATDRPLYFPGETITVRGHAADGDKKPTSVKVSGAVHGKYRVEPDGKFEFELPATGSGQFKLVLTADDLPAVTVRYVVVADELAFPRLFGTDRSHQLGLFVTLRKQYWPLLPYWAQRFGAEFVALCPPETGLPRHDPLFDQMLTQADRLGLTVARVGWMYVPKVSDERTMQTNGKKHQFTGNALSLRSQKIVYDEAIRFVSARRHHSSFRYLLFKTERFTMGSSEGYDRENLERIAEVVRKARPKLELPDTKDPKAWHELLSADEELYQLWRVWREGVWTDFMVRLNDALKVIRADFELGVCETQMRGVGLWNLGMLASRGITAQAPHCNFPHCSYWETMLAARDRKAFGNEQLFLSMSVWADVNYEIEQLYSGLFGAIKFGGTAIPAWSDSGFRGRWEDLKPKFGKGQIRSIDQWAKVRIEDGAMQSPITDMLTGIDGHRKARALERAGSQIRNLPYKDRFTLYDRYDGRLPVDFGVSWIEKSGKRRSKSTTDGISAGSPYDSVYAVVQDYQPNGYVEMFVFNDVQQNRSPKQKKLPTILDAAGWIKTYTYEPSTLSERSITVMTRGGKNVVPFIDGAPWLHYQRRGSVLFVASVPFEAQQVRLLQLVRCGRDLPHVTQSSIPISNTMLNFAKRRLWLKLSNPNEGDMTIDCIEWAEPNKIEGGRLVNFDLETRLAKIAVAPAATWVAINWQ